MGAGASNRLLLTVVSFQTLAMEQHWIPRSLQQQILGLQRRVQEIEEQAGQSKDVKGGRYYDQKSLVTNRVFGK